MIRFPALVVASKNPDKIREVEAVLADLGLDIVGGLDWPDVEETGGTLEENALLKARAVAAATGLPALADDTGLEVDALGGAPGVYAARYSGPAATYSSNVAKLLAEMTGVSERRAVFRTVIAVVDPGGDEWLAEGSLEGTIALAARGENGFGYDPVFQVGERTLAEMTAEEKNSFSHRARALAAIASALAAA